MQYPAHMSVGLGVGMAASSIILERPENVIIFTIASLFGSVLPDIDHKGSWISKRLFFISFFTSKLFQHRIQTHTPMYNIIFFSLMYFGFSTIGYSEIGILLSGGLFVGVMTHIFLDFTTKAGVPLLKPFTSKMYSLNLFKTGGLGEQLFLVLGIGMFLFGLINIS